MCFQIIKTVFLLSSFAILTLSQSQIQISCGLTEWPDTCPDSKDPVCAPTPHECETTPCFQNTEYSSACEACKDAGVSSYRFGKCQYSCDPENLPPSDALADQDFPACAYYQQNCKDATCRNSFGRASIACQDGAVLYFELQTCPGKNLDPVIIIDLEDDENGNPPPEEEEEEEPQEEPVPVEEENTVIIEEESPIIVEEESTIVVEEESPVIEEEEGPIEEQPIVEEEQPGNQVIVLACSNTDTQDCNQFYRPVCPIDCQDDSQCGKTVINACQACTDPNIISYTPGTCRSERTWCRDVFNPEEDLPCSINFDPVCIYKLDCAEEPCGKTARNVCDACGTREGDYFIKGGCIGN